MTFGRDVDVGLEFFFLKTVLTTTIANVCPWLGLELSVRFSILISNSPVQLLTLLSFFTNFVRPRTPFSRLIPRTTGVVTGDSVGV